MVTWLNASFEMRFRLIGGPTGTSSGWPWRDRENRPAQGEGERS